MQAIAMCEKTEEEKSRPFLWSLDRLENVVEEAGLDVLMYLIIGSGV
jgi:hypothetical protein